MPCELYCAATYFSLQGTETGCTIPYGSPLIDPGSCMINRRFQCAVDILLSKTNGFQCFLGFSSGNDSVKALVNYYTWPFIIRTSDGHAEIIHVHHPRICLNLRFCSILKDQHHSLYENLDVRAYRLSLYSFVCRGIKLETFQTQTLVYSINLEFQNITVEIPFN